MCYFLDCYFLVTVDTFGPVQSLYCSDLLSCSRRCSGVDSPSSRGQRVSGEGHQGSGEGISRWVGDRYISGWVGDFYISGWVRPLCQRVSERWLHQRVSGRLLYLRVCGMGSAGEWERKTASEWEIDIWVGEWEENSRWEEKEQLVIWRKTRGEWKANTGWVGGKQRVSRRGPAGEWE